MREPLLLPFAAVAAGICCARVAPVPVSYAALAALAAGALALIALLVRSRVLWPAARLIALAFAGMAFAGARAVAPVPKLSVPDNAPAIFDGCVVDPALTAADRERFTAELAPGARAQVSLYAKPGEDFPALPYGTPVEFEAKVRTPHNYNNPGSFDNAHFLARQRIFWNASGNVSGVRRLPGRCGNAAAGLIFTIRSAALDRLDRLYSGDAYANGMMQALLIGATAKLDRIWTEDYRSTGTFHAIVISGSHVAVITAVLLFFLRICAVPEGMAVFLTILTAWLYAGVAGWQAPVLRSAAGMSLYGIARCFYRRGRLLNIVAAVALAFVAVDPEQLFDPSFQLSFLAVGVIGAFVIPVLEASSAPLARSLSVLGDRARDIRLTPRTAQFLVEMRLLARTLSLVFALPVRASGFIVSMAARLCFFVYEVVVASFFIQIGLALPMIVYFHRLSLSGLSANVIVVPVLSAIVPLGFLAIAANSPVLAHLCAWLLEVARAAVGFHARWEPDWRIPAPPFWLAAGFAAALLLAAWRANKRLTTRIAAWVLVAAALAVIVIHPFAPRVEKGKFELSVIDVGQGDGLFLAFPDGTLMLVDAGGIPSFGRASKPGIDIGEDVVSPYLWSRSIRHLDIVAVTHGHEDHIGGMNAVVKNFHPREIWTGATQTSPEWRGVEETARRLRIPILHKLRGAAFPFAGTTMRILAPSADYRPDIAPKNDDSLVMRILFGETSFLLTGDMEKKIEEELFFDGLLQHSDVLKVGHHGSHTSSTPDLLDAVHPAFGIISAGFDNSYGHPHPLTLSALSERHVAVYRTDRQGLITVVSDGRRLSVTKAAD